MRYYHGTNVFDSSFERIKGYYEEGHTVVVSFSGGKDSGVCLELAIMAAKATGNLPVKVLMRDEEIMAPGTFEYAERMANRPEVEFHWVIANQPIINAFCREMPYYWVFDPMLSPDEWVRKPPPFAEVISDLNIEKLVTRKRFNVPEDKELISVIGLRTEESPMRLMAVHSTKGGLSKRDASGARRCHLIYDWTVKDIWYAIKHFGWDYNSAYDTFTRYGVPARGQRIAPPLLNAAALRTLRILREAYPQWFVRVTKRLDGVREAALFGRVSVLPIRNPDETWEECFYRTCVNEAPEWIAERALVARDFVVARHGRHSTTPYPQNKSCATCPHVKSWRMLAYKFFHGDPFLFSGVGGLSCIEPEFFRKGSGTWGGGKPAFA